MSLQISQSRILRHDFPSYDFLTALLNGSTATVSTMFFADPFLPTVVLSGERMHYHYPNFATAPLDQTFGMTPRLGHYSGHVVQFGSPPPVYGPPQVRGSPTAIHRSVPAPEQNPSYVSDLYSSIGSTSSRVSASEHAHDPNAIRWSKAQEVLTARLVQNIGCFHVHQTISFVAIY